MKRHLVRGVAAGALALGLELGPAAFAEAADKPSPARVFDSSQLADLEAMVAVLRARVAELDVELAPRPDEPLTEPVREGYGVVLGPRHVATLSFNVEGAKRISIRGPSGRAVSAKVVLLDPERRVAILEAAAPLSEAGLVPADVAPRAEVKQGDDVFALVSTAPEATVMHGGLIYVGDEPEYEGHHRADLKLTLGMPVFDRRARFVGYSRAVAWDKDKLLLVTPEIIRAARTATGAADREKAAAKSDKKPWWSK